jgi:hypothetical protein
MDRGQSRIKTLTVVFMFERATLNSDEGSGGAERSPEDGCDRLV